MSMKTYTNPNPPITNFLRYPGSKRRMLSFLGPYLPQASLVSGHHVEPFVGGGAVFLYQQPRRAILSDINRELIDLYRGIRLDPHAVWARYCNFGNTKADYRRARATEPPSRIVARSARTLYLNRTCFKGMWRHNREGQFNVGYGGQSRRWVITESALVGVSRQLRHARLKCADFEEVIDETEEADFIFADPPYRPGEKELRNDHYAYHQFTFEDHRRLAAALKRAQKRGVRWAITTSAHPDIVRLFNNKLIVPFSRGTGPLPGRLLKDSGEILLLNFTPNGAPQ